METNNLVRKQDPIAEFIGIRPKQNTYIFDASSIKLISSFV